MLSQVLSASVYGINGYIVTVEVDISSGFPTFNIVGLPDTSVKESRDRVISAIKNSGFDFPTKKVTVNLAPAGVKKEGAIYDLPIAIGILLATEQIHPVRSEFTPLDTKLSNGAGLPVSNGVKTGAQKYALLGELSLDGSIRRVNGVLPIAIKLKEEKFDGLVLPEMNKNEAAIVDGLNVYPASNLKKAVEIISVGTQTTPYKIDLLKLFSAASHYEVDFKDVKGQAFVKRAVEIACAGGHNILLIGAPGSGKTMLTKRIPTVLPPMSFEEAIETTKIHSISGLTSTHSSLIATRPFRSPHHTISDVALIGGGSYPKPGEVSLSHNGVLFLDELPEFHRNVLEVLRQPLEDGIVTVSRAQASLTYPARFMLVAAMNPCPCGYYGHPTKECTCTPFVIQKYISKISGPLLDRIDLHIDVPSVRFEELSESSVSDSSQDIRKRITKVRQIQKERFKTEKNIYCNAHMESKHIKIYCEIGDESKKLLKHAMDKLGFSARAHDRILKVARTIADLSGSENIQTPHIAEAIQYRSLDRSM